MFKNLVPSFTAKNVFEIEVDFYKKLNIKYLFCDLDNTLEVFNIKEPSQRVVDLNEELKKNDIKLIIISNNSKKRVEKYAKILSVNFIYRSFKPNTLKFNKFIKKNNFNKENILLVGDQLLTDIKCANKLGIKSMYVEELAKKNALVTKVNKFIEGIFKKKVFNSNTIKDWRDYGNC